MTRHSLFSSFALEMEWWGRGQRHGAGDLVEREEKNGREEERGDRRSIIFIFSRKREAGFMLMVTNDGRISFVRRGRDYPLHFILCKRVAQWPNGPTAQRISLI